MCRLQPGKRSKLSLIKKTNIWCFIFFFKDKSTIAISFDNKITLWDVELLSIIATLSLSDSESNGPYTSLAFASRSCLLAADENTVHNWNLIANHLTHKISLQQPRIVKTLKLPMIITSNGIIRMDEKLRLQYLTKGISHVTSLTASESQVVGKVIWKNQTKWNHKTLLLFCSVFSSESILVIMFSVEFI